MPYNGSGVFVRIYSWQNDAANGIDITASRMDTDTNDMTNNGFGLTLTKDGQVSAAANLPMNTFRHTNVGEGVDATDYARLDQVQASQISWVVAGGTPNAITATYSPPVTALTDGLLLWFRATAANSSTVPTFAPNGLTAHTITKVGGQALLGGDIPGALAECVIRYNLANTRWELLNPANPEIIPGATASIATATPTTIIALGSLANNGAGRIAVTAYLSNAGAGNYTAATDVLCDGTNARLVNTVNGALLTITLSGLNVQVTQSSGGNQVVNWSYVRLGV